MPASVASGKANDLAVETGGPARRHATVASGRPRSWSLGRRRRRPRPAGSASSPRRTCTVSAAVGHAVRTALEDRAAQGHGVEAGAQAAGEVEQLPDQRPGVAVGRQRVGLVGRGRARGSRPTRPRPEAGHRPGEDRRRPAGWSSRRRRERGSTTTTTTARRPGRLPRRLDAVPEAGDERRHGQGARAAPSARWRASAADGTDQGRLDQVDARSRTGQRRAGRPAGHASRRRPAAPRKGSAAVSRVPQDGHGQRPAARSARAAVASRVKRLPARPDHLAAKLSMMLIAAGPMTAMNRQGRMQKISGMVILTGTCWAFSSAR